MTTQLQAPVQQVDHQRAALLYAREQCALLSEANDQTHIATRWRIGLYDHLPDIQNRVEAYLEGRQAAYREAAEVARVERDRQTGTSVGPEACGFQDGRREAAHMIEQAILALVDRSAT